MGMRRTTRVFGLVKAVDGARVLRSGRRIWSNVDEPKVKRTHDVVDRDWNCLLKSSSKVNKGNNKVSSRVVSMEKEEEEDSRVKKRRKLGVESEGDEKTVDKMFGIVYSKKNKKKKRLSDQSSEKKPLLCYSRRRRVSLGSVITLRVNGSCREECWLSTVFRLVMRYSRKEELRLSSLASFFLSYPVKNAFADHGVRFLLNELTLTSRGVCKFYGAMNCLPLFSADFSAIPRCFMVMHLTLSFAFVKKSLHLLNNPVEEPDSECELVLSKSCNPSNESVVELHPLVRASKLHRGNLGFHSIQKRRSSLRRRRGRNLSHKLYNGTSVSELSGCWKNRAAAVSSSRKLRSSVLSNSSQTQSSNGISIIPNQRAKGELDSLCCSANLLMIGSDRCTREEGFGIMLEYSSSNEWLIAIKKDGVVRFSLTAQKTMRPCSSNRFTHSIVWVGDNNWKLEFCDKQDWVDFKEIYQECYDRNVLEQNLKVIPIPGVREVCGYAKESNDFPPFSMPISYISVKDDEVSRAMGRTIAIYDMDSEDEEWVERQNKEEDEQNQQLQRESFELMIDGFEKRYFESSANNLLDEKAASVASLSYLGRQEMVEAVYDYWARKRKQRKASLLRVFQGHQAKKTALLSKPVFRKKRSFKRQGSKQLHGKAKQLSLVAVKVAEQEAERKVLLKVVEAKAFAKTSMEIAIAKRRRAQILAENADLAVYKAMMSLKIAEALKAGESGYMTTTSDFLN